MSIFESGVYRIISKNYMQAIADGEVDGLIPWAKSGYSPASTAAETVVWSAGTDYVFPTAEMQMEVVSSDNGNDKAGGTGALTVEIIYLNSLFEEKKTSVTLNGSTAVATDVSDIYRINSFYVTSWGTGLKPAGNITIRHLSDTPIYERIDAGRNASRSFFYTVPKNKKLYISNIYFSASANAAGKRVLFTTMGTYNTLTKTTTAGAFFPYTDITLMDSSVSVDLQMPTEFCCGADIKIVIIGEAGAVCSCGARGWIKPI